MTEPWASMIRPVTVALETACPYPAGALNAIAAVRAAAVEIALQNVGLDMNPPLSGPNNGWRRLYCKHFPQAVGFRHSQADRPIYFCNGNGTVRPVRTE